MAIIGPGGDPVSGSDAMVLSSVGTTRFNVYHPDDSRADSREDYEPQLQADVSNVADYAQDITVAWYFGSTKVAERTQRVSAYGSETLARRVSWSDMDAKGLVPGDYPLKAKLPANGSTEEYGTMHLHEQGGNGEPGLDTGDGGPGTCPEGYYYDTAFQMCLPGSTDPNDDGTNDGGDTGGSGDDPSTDGPAALLPDGFPLLPAVGPLSAEQTTLAAVVGVPLLVVILK